MRQEDSKKVWMGFLALGLLLLVLLPVILIGGLLSSIVVWLNPFSIQKEQEDSHYLALQAVSARYEPENTLDMYLVKIIDLFHHDKITENQREIEAFIETYFLLEKERETAEGEKETYYVYKTFYEIVSTVRQEPFLFGDGAIASIINLSISGVAGSGPALGPDGKPIIGPSNEGTLNGKYPAPLQNGVITCPYGKRVNPISGKTETHAALDIQGAWHAPISTIADGVVESIHTEVGPYGNYIVIRHELPEGTFWSKYAHLSQINVQVGQPVSQGGAIGVEGGDPNLDPNPGWTTGHHLHLEIWTAEGHVNPADYIY